MYTTIDRRLLGLFRIAFGLLLLCDVVRRFPDATFFYSNSGVLSNHFALFAPLAKPFFSIFNVFSTPAEVRVAFLLTAVVYVFYIFGYHTRLAQGLAFVLVTSLNTRNLFLENGGCLVVNLVAAWTLFLPIGDRFSVDALVRRLRRREQSYDDLNDRNFTGPDLTPHRSLAVLAILLQLAVIYFFNAVHKTGATWRQGEAVHWILWQNRIATTWAAWLRLHEPAWFSPVMTRATLIIEGCAPVLLLLPWARARLRTLYVVATTSLHGGIALLMTLGPFSYVMICFNILMLPGELFDQAAARLRRGLTAARVRFDPNDPVAYAAVRVLSRLDTFGLLTFIPAEADEAFSLHEANGAAPYVGSEAFVRAVRRLPWGRMAAPLLASSLGHRVLQALLSWRDGLEELLAPLAPQPSTSSPTPLVTPWSTTLRQGREGLILLLLVAAAMDLSRSNQAIPDALRLPSSTAFSQLILYPRLLQGWGMFAPDAPQEDGTVVVDAITANGRHLDPFTGAPPDFDAPWHGPWFQSQFWCDYFLKISWDGNRRYREELKTYLFAWQTLQKRLPSDQLISFDVWWVSNRAPPPGKTEPFDIQKRLLLSAAAGSR